MSTHHARRNVLGDSSVFSLLCIALFSIVTKSPAAQASGKEDLLQQLSVSSEVLVKKVSPSVVQVRVTGYASSSDSAQGNAGLVIGRQRSLGSGVIVDPDGYIMTNAHVVGSGGRVEVVLPLVDEATVSRSLRGARGRTLEARVVGVARELDLALLKVDAQGLPALAIAKYGNLRQGQMVFAFGSPEGFRNSVSMGLVSSVARQLDPDSPLVFVQTDAPINPGNSGGPLVNVDGQLVGINTLIMSQSGGNEGLGFAIPSSFVEFVFPQLRKYGHIHRGEMGVQVQSVTPELATGLHLARDWGVLVSDVLPGSPADKAGVKMRDIIVSIDSRPTESLPIFGLTLFTRPAGEAAKVELLRGSEKIMLDVPVVDRPHKVDRLADMVDPEKNYIEPLGVLGIEVNASLSEIMPDLREPSGVIVIARAAGSRATENSLTSADVIHEVNGLPIITLDGLRSALAQLKPETPAVLQIERAQRMMYLTLPRD
jgi:serine protease Do